MAASTYTPRTSASHLSARAIAAYLSRTVAMAIPIPNASTHAIAGTPVSRCAASAMPPKSAPTLIMLAMNSVPAAVASSHRGYFDCSAPASPQPVTSPIRAHIICTAAIAGQSTGAVQRNCVPNWAPVMEYVAIPEGSSSAAPVMMPGPSAATTRRRAETLSGA
jgi:hypothetical protein